MKKLNWFVLMGLLFSLGACQSAPEKTEQSAASTTEEVKDDVNQETTYTGELTEDAVVGEDIVRLTFKEVKSESKEDALDVIGPDGVILNAERKTIQKGEDPKDWKAGTMIEFTVQDPVVMTRSIPPQIPGNVIKKVERVK